MKSKGLSARAKQSMAEKVRKVFLDCYSNPIFKSGNLAPELVKVKVFSSGCGDRLFLDFRFDENAFLQQITYSGEGCVIFMATIELIFRQIFRKNKEFISNFAQEFNKLIDQESFDSKLLGPLVLLVGSPALETRAQCFRLANKVAQKISNS